MAALILLKQGVDWTASGGLFDWTLEFLIARIYDKEAIERIREIVDNGLGSLWITEFPVATQQDIAAQLRGGLIAAAEHELPAGEHKAAAIRQLQELVNLTHELDKP